MSHAHGAGVANEKLAFGAEFLTQLIVGRLRQRRKKISLHAVFDDGNFLRWNPPALDQMLTKRRGYDHDPVGTLIKKTGYCSQRAMQQRFLIPDPDGGQ